MFCAVHAAGRGARVLAIDHARAPGEKIRISGGGRCNFTNLRTAPGCFVSRNQHFAKSALARYAAADFVRLVERHRIAYHEKTLGQLFCDRSSRDIIELLLAEMAAAGAALRLNTAIGAIEKTEDGFRVELETEGRRSVASARRLVIATGGKSIPKMGATGFGYRVAEQFGLELVETRPGLVPLTFGGDPLAAMKALAGVATHGVARAGKATFEEALLFTHRGIIGTGDSADFVVLARGRDDFDRSRAGGRAVRRIEGGARSKWATGPGDRARRACAEAIGACFGGSGRG